MLNIKASLKMIMLLAILFTATVLISSCAPAQKIDNNVVPTLYSVTRPADAGSMLLVQGRYYGDGQNFQDSYVILGADVNGNGGVRVIPTAWSTTMLTVPIPENAGAGFVFVVIDGIKSNGLPANIQ